MQNKREFLTLKYFLITMKELENQINVSPGGGIGRRVGLKIQLG